MTKARRIAFLFVLASAALVGCGPSGERRFDIPPGRKTGLVLGVSVGGPSKDPCDETFGPGEYRAWDCDRGEVLIVMPEISCEDALEMCELFTDKALDLNVVCTWKEQLLLEAEASEGACDYLSEF
jgi:hypothetical protein